MQADDAAHSPSEAAADAEVAAGGDVNVDDGRHDPMAGSSGSIGHGGGSTGGGGGGGRDADDELHSYVGELVSCL